MEQEEQQQQEERRSTCANGGNQRWRRTGPNAGDRQGQDKARQSGGGPRVSGSYSADDTQDDWD
eukprot:7259065-Pyramimonas_sp.AAC.1